MFKARGLYGHIRNNNIKSLVMFLGFLLVMQLLGMAVLTGYTTIVVKADMATQWRWALWFIRREWLVVFLASLLWVLLAIAFYKIIITWRIKAVSVSRVQEPRLYNLVENLCIASGIAMPKLAIIEDNGLNSFAMGYSTSHAKLVVTRGLMLGLNDQELEAVLAHELIHIQSRDIRLMAFATVFCGIALSLFQYLTGSNATIFHRYRWIVTLGLYIVFGTVSIVLVFAMLALVSIAFLSSLLIKQFISKRREFMADAGACEMTKNPRALISALLKISGRAQTQNYDIAIQAMMISAPEDGIFSTHPTLSARIAAIEAYAVLHPAGLRPTLFQPTARPTGFGQGALQIIECLPASQTRLPSWVSNPLLVIPVLMAGFMMHEILVQKISPNFGDLRYIIMFREGEPKALPDYGDLEKRSAIFYYPANSTVADKIAAADKDEQKLSASDRVNRDAWSGVSGYSLLFNLILILAYGFITMRYGITEIFSFLAKYFDRPSFTAPVPKIATPDGADIWQSAVERVVRDRELEVSYQKQAAQNINFRTSTKFAERPTFGKRRL